MHIQNSWILSKRIVKRVFLQLFSDLVSFAILVGKKNGQEDNEMKAGEEIG